MLHMRMCSSPTSNSLGKKRRFTCFHSTRLVIVLFTCLCGMFGQLADNNSGGDNQIITIHISDFGIEQPWHNDMRAGDSLEYWNSGNLLHKDLNTAYPGLLGIHILEPMPSDSDLEARDKASALAGRDGGLIAKAVLGATKDGLHDVELQLVQHINIPGYFDFVSRQVLVDRFGNIAYTALGSAIKSLEAHGYRVNIEFVLGSNGTKAFAASVPSWAPYKDRITRIDLIDGRALFDPMCKVMEELGPTSRDKIRLFNSYNDQLAHKGSMGYFDTGTELQRRYPGIAHYRLTDLSLPADAPIGAAHIQSIVAHDDHFKVETCSSSGCQAVQGPFMAADFRRQGPLVAKEADSRIRSLSMQSSQIKNYWADNSPLTPVGKSATEAELMSQMVQKGQRILVAGDGQVAKQIYDAAAKRAGATTNVAWLREYTNMEDLQIAARSFEANAILGVRGKAPVPQISFSAPEPHLPERMKPPPQISQSSPPACPPSSPLCGGRLPAVEPPVCPPGRPECGGLRAAAGIRHPLPPGGGVSSQFGAGNVGGVMLSGTAKITDVNG